MSLSIIYNMSHTCAICDKPIPDGATHCSAKCLGEERIKGMDQISKARSSFVESMSKMLKMEVEPSKIPESPMIVLQHRWKRNRTDVVGTTVVAFNGIGEARVPFVGHVMADVEALVRASRGLVSFHIEQPGTAESAIPDLPAVVSPAPDIAAAISAAVESKAEVQEPEVFESATDEFALKSNEQIDKFAVLPKKKHPAVPKKK